METAVLATGVILRMASMSCGEYPAEVEVGQPVVEGQAGVLQPPVVHRQL